MPGPLTPMKVDWTRSDAELFKDHFTLAGGGAMAMGDLWPDVPCRTVIV